VNPVDRRGEGGQRDEDAGKRDDDAGLRDDVADERDVVGGQRDADAELRDEDAASRDLKGERRDDAGDRRDSAAERRDQHAGLRDRAADQRDRDAELSDSADTGVGSATGEAHRISALVREHAASDRRRAGEDRREAAGERDRAALDRGTALADRVAGASGRDSSGRDRGTALADRTAGAGRRDSSGRDRDTAMDDRAAAAIDRQFAADFASSLQFGWTVRQLDPPEFLYVSPGYLRIYGLGQNRSDLCLAEALAMIHPDDLHPAMPSRWDPTDVASTVEMELRIVRPDGEIRWIRSISNPVIDADGSFTRASTTVEDITARKDAEAATSTAQHAAERANAAKSEFLSRMSHEFRTPLNAVLGFAQLLEMDSLSASQDTAVGHILRSGRHLLQMIDGVLDISRIETGRLTVSSEPVLVDDLLADAVAAMKPVAAAAQIAIRHEGAAFSAGVCVLGDRRRLREVVLQLMSNAIKYNSRGGWVQIGCSVSVAQSQVHLTITDNGCGIRPDELAGLFVPFAGVTQKRSDIEGAGIGLALTHRLVSIMGGQLDVTSEFGFGSTFSLILPLAAVLSSQDGGDAPDAALVAVTRSTLLLIEDDQSCVDLIERILDRRPEWTMVSAGRVAQGLELAGQVDPTMILLDAQKSDASAIDLLKALRGHELTSGVPLVVLRADNNPSQTRRYQAAGADRHLTTPIDVHAVLEILDLYANQDEVRAR
jgi:PAS domain S-box-containing protein